MMKPDIDTEKYNDASLTRRPVKMIETKSKRAQSTPYSPHSTIFIASRKAIRHRKGVMGPWVDKKISYYTYPLTNCKFPLLGRTLPPFK